jgi:hypothetical protein
VRIATTIVLGLLVAACGSPTTPVPSTTPTGSPVPSAAAVPSETPGVPSAVPTATPSPSQPTVATNLGFRGSAREIGERIGMAPGPDGTLFVSIPRSGGSVLARLDRGGRPIAGWPITIKNSTGCGSPLAVDDGSVRIICDGTDLPTYDNDPSDVRAFAFDAEGRSMPGWPIRLRPGFGRVIGDELTYFAEQYVTDTYDVGTVSHVAWVTTIAVDGSVRVGEKVPMTETCCLERWAIGPDGNAYGSSHDYGGSVEAPKSSQLMSVSLAGIRAGFPVALDGAASPPAFDAAGRLHVTVNAGPDRTARTLIFDTRGRAVPGGSDDLGFAATDSCDGIEGSCEVPATPLIGADGTTFVTGAYFTSTVVARVDTSGEVMGGWPYRSDDGNQGTGVCPPTDICEGSSLATPALGPDNSVHLIHSAAVTSAGGRLIAIGPDGQVRPGWPVELKRRGAEFWSVAVGSDGTVYALAIEPEASDGSSASILAIAPDSTVRWITTIIGP